MYTFKTFPENKVIREKNFTVTVHVPILFYIKYCPRYRLKILAAKFLAVKFLAAKVSEERKISMINDAK
jgi:predicted metalloprotease